MSGSEWMPNPGTQTNHNPMMASSEAQSSRRRFGGGSQKEPWDGRPNQGRIGLVLLGILVVLIGTILAVKALSGGDAESVRDVADAAVDAAKDIDVDAGIDLFCEKPSEGQRDQIDDFIATGQDLAGTDRPEVNYSVRNVEGDKEGSFEVLAWSDDGKLRGHYTTAEVEVSRDGDRSCVSDIDIEQHEGPRPL